MSFWILYAGAPVGVLLLFLAAIIVMGLWLKVFFRRKSKAEFYFFFLVRQIAQISHRESPKHHKRTSHVTQI